MVFQGKDDVIGSNEFMLGYLIFFVLIILGIQSFIFKSRIIHSIEIDKTANIFLANISFLGKGEAGYDV